MSQLSLEWSTVCLADTCKLFTDGNWIESKDQSTDGVRLIQTGNVGNGSFKDRRGKARWISPETFDRLKCQEIIPGDCLVSRLPDPVGRSCIIPVTGDKMITAVDCSILRFDLSILSPDFFNYFSQSRNYLSDVESKCSGATRKRISRKNLGMINIPLPPLSEQKRIVAILDEAFAAISQAVSNAEKNLTNARELFESYLNNVFTQKGEGWKEKKLGDAELLQIIDGDRGVNYPKKTDFLTEGFCLFLNTKNVRPDGFNFHTTMFITEQKDKALRKGKLKRRDVLLTTRGTIGNIALYDESVDFDDIRINSGMLIFRPNEKVILSEYFFEVLRSGIMKSQIERFVSGAAQPQLPIKTLVNFTIPVPVELVDQQKIVAQLRDLISETQKLEQVYQQKLDVLAELKQSILQKAFAGELTADTVQQQVN